MSDSTTRQSFDLDWAYAAAAPTAEGVLRLTPEDFRVTEQLGFEPCGEGEHVYLQIVKRGENTAWLAQQIAHLAGVDNHDVGYAGLKDRHAIASQWFSVYLPKGSEPDWRQLESDSVTLEQAVRHRQKLRRGAHCANQFRICLQQLENVDQAELEQRLQRVQQQGVPNYFGAQRFGHQGNNLQEAERMLVAGNKVRNRRQRGLYLSAARSWLFNRVLDQRVRDASWSTPLPGEVLLDGGPSGPLWGRGRLAGGPEAVSLEERVLHPWRDWCGALEHVGLSQQRRALVCRPQNFAARLEGAGLEVRFELPPGEFATTVLREICRLKETSDHRVML